MQKKINSKIFVADIGNSYSKIAVLDQNRNVLKKIIFKTLAFFKISYLVKKIKKITTNYDLNGAIVGSVVSKHTNQFIKAIWKTLAITPYIINSKTKLNFTLKNIDKDKVGHDILALAQYCSFKNPNALGFSFGTAIFGIFLNNNNLEGVSIASGLGVGFENLLAKVKLLRVLNFNKFDNIFYGKETLTALESGFNNLRSGFVLNFYSQVQKKFSFKNLSCTITGGEAGDIDVEFEYEVNLNAILIGYGLIYFANCK